MAQIIQLIMVKENKYQHEVVRNMKCIKKYQYMDDLDKNILQKV